MTFFKNSLIVAGSTAVASMTRAPMINATMNAKIGTTGRGIGPTYGDKVARVGFRVLDLVNQERFPAKLRERVAAITLKDKSKVFNTARIEALEVENLMEAAQATMTSAAARHECRGAHTVNDYERPADDPQFPLGRNDAEWMKHTLWYMDGNRLDYKPVRMKPLTAETVPPKPRTF